MARITFWPLAQMVKQAASIDESDAADEALAKLEALLEPDEDAPTIAETIAHLTGLKETTGVVEEGFWAVRRLFAGWQLLGRSSSCSTTPTGPKRRFSS